MLRNAYGVGLGILLALAGAGCASSAPQSPPRATAAWGAVSPSLVMPALGPGSTLHAGSAGSSGGPNGWEYRRHDDRLSVGHVPPAAQFSYVQIETRDRLRIDNGRPREHSTTRIHTIRQRLDR
ncbi:MAG: hypothetical protein IIB99_09050 [Planctomycetes bacterium]|nr:hypothetical protein [Planctomycetota bacterium]MCH8211509.1 hypothetical protein [Planctomycetota bacterium]